MKKIILAVLIFAVGIATGLGIGHWKSQRDAKAMILADEMRTISLCANGLNTLADNMSPRTVRMLDRQLRSAIATATEFSAASADFEVAMPSLFDGLQRAKRYAERTSDKQLAAQITQLQASIKQPTS